MASHWLGKTALSIIMGLVIISSVLPAAGEEASRDLSVLLGKWVWEPTRAGRPYSIVVTITGIRPDGTLEGTYTSPDVVRSWPQGVPLAANGSKASVADGKIQVEINLGRGGLFELEYAKGVDGLLVTARLSRGAPDPNARFVRAK